MRDESEFCQVAYFGMCEWTGESGMLLSGGNGRDSSGLCGG